MVGIAGQERRSDAARSAGTAEARRHPPDRRSAKPSFATSRNHAVRSVLTPAASSAARTRPACNIPRRDPPGLHLLGRARPVHRRTTDGRKRRLSGSGQQERHGPCRMAARRCPQAWSPIGSGRRGQPLTIRRFRLPACASVVPERCTAIARNTAPIASIATNWPDHVESGPAVQDRLARLP